VIDENTKKHVHMEKRGLRPCSRLSPVSGLTEVIVEVLSANKEGAFRGNARVSECGVRCSLGGKKCSPTARNVFSLSLFRTRETRLPACASARSSGLHSYSS